MKNTVKLVKENMSTHLITIGWGQKIGEAYKRMQTARIRHLPVLNDTGEVVGMLSDRDVQRAMISTLDRSAGRLISDETIEFDPESKVRDYMSWPAQAVDQNTDLRQVAEMMLSERISALLVFDGGRVMGIVTVDDLLRVLVALLSTSGSGWTLKRAMEDTLDQLKHSLV